MTLEDIRNSHLVTGEGNPSETWDRDWRGRLVTNLSLLVRQLWQIGIDQVFVDGSFVENKDHPNDIDGYFETDTLRVVTGTLTQELNALDPYQVWTWSHIMRRPDPNSAKLQLPMWHKYRVELYPHYGQPAGILDQHGNNLLFPAAFRKSRIDHRPKGLFELSNRKSELYKRLRMLPTPSAALQGSQKRPFFGARHSPERRDMMIRNDTEYQSARQRLDEDRDFAVQQKAALEAQGFTPEQVERGLEATLSYHAQLAEEVDWYERVRRREIAPLQNLTQIGRLLIGLRIANGLSQRELAERLCVAESQISRDERNEYHGVTMERAQRVLDALGETLNSFVAGADIARIAAIKEEPAKELANS